MSTEAIFETMEQIEQAEKSEDVVQALARLVDSRGFDFYALVRQPKPHEDPMRLLMAGRLPKGWPEAYIKKKYVLIDPTIRYLAHAQNGFRWNEPLAAFSHDPHVQRMQRMMADARRYGLHDGYVFPVHSRRGLAGSLSVAGRPVELSRREMELFDLTSRAAFWKLNATRSSEEEVRLAEPLEIKMTHREMEALNYLSDGMTSPEIASVLNISNHTVDWYMNGIQQKLKAKNRHHAVAIAFRLGLIF